MALHALDEITQALLDGHLEAVEFGDLALDDQLHPAVRQVSHMTRQIMAPRNPSAGRTEPHSLNPA